MLLLSIDIETTGLDPDVCQIIQLGAVVYDTDNPSREHATFETLVKHDVIVGEPYALAMNAELLKRIAKGEGEYLDTVMTKFLGWVGWQSRRILEQEPGVGPHPKFTPVGKNYGGFDKLFLRKHPLFKQLPLTHRSIDVGNLFWRPSIDGANLPDSAECMRRAVREGNVAHTALADAWEAVHAAAMFVAMDAPVIAPRPRIDVPIEPLSPSLYETTVSGDGSGMALPEIDATFVNLPSDDCPF